LLEAFWLDVTTSKDECTWTRLTSVVFTREQLFTEENRFSSPCYYCSNFHNILLKLRFRIWE